MAFAFQPAVDVLLHLDGTFAVIARDEHHGDVMPSSITQRRLADRKALAVVRSQNAQRAFLGFAVPGDMNRM